MSLDTIRTSEPQVVRYGGAQALQDGLHRRPHAGQRQQGELYDHRRRGVRERRPARPQSRSRTGSTSARRASRRSAGTRCTPHRTAEVFFVLKGRWRFFWGRWGTAGEVVLEEGDIINIPTGIFRGFENIGTDYGMIMAVLGGDDAGGGVIWAPQVIEDAADHGLVLGGNGKLYDTKGGPVPAGGRQAHADADRGGAQGVPRAPDGRRSCRVTSRGTGT